MFSILKKKPKFDDPILQNAWEEVEQLEKEGKLEEYSQRAEEEYKRFVEEHGEIESSKEFDEKMYKMFDEAARQKAIERENKKLKNRVKNLFKKKK